MEISENARITLQDNVHIQELNGEAVLLNLNNNHYFSLDSVSYRMFLVLSSTGTIKEAIDTLSNEYDVQPEQLKLDCMEFIESLMEAGLVKANND